MLVLYVEYNSSDNKKLPDISAWQFFLHQIILYYTNSMSTSKAPSPLRWPIFTILV